jgi:hypothetical protein
MEKVFEIIGIFTIGIAISYGIFHSIKKVKWNNPIKSYIRKIVLDYLKELQN